MKELSRRGFLVSAGVAAGAAALTGLAGCSSSGADESWMPTWNEEADVIVVGFGGAGALAAISTVDAGGSCIVIEKDKERTGGSTGCSGGHLHTCVGVDVEEWYKTFKHGAFGAEGWDEATCKNYLSHFNDTPDAMEKFGIPIDWVDETNDGHKRPEEYQGGYVAGKDGIVGMYLFEAINDAAEERDIDVRLSTSATELIQNPLTKEIVGVKATDVDGNELYFKGKKGVVLACGGYENNTTIQFNNNYPGVRIFPWGSPYNTGDAITMGSRVGAQMWHMHALEFASLCYTLPSTEANCSIATDATDGITPYNYVIVDFNGKRFMKEDKTGAHDMDAKAAFDFDSKTCDYKHLPMFLIFDQTMFEARNPLWAGSGRAGIVNTYAGVWGFNHPDDKILVWDDNESAISNGWIFKGETIEELAATITANRPCGDESEKIVGINAETLATTVSDWNNMCAAGQDTKYNRDPTHMLPLNTPPFYAIELSYSTINTQGGPKRNDNCQTVNADNVAIPRLYNVGECGSWNSMVYTVGNILEAVTTGRVAGEHAMSLEAWDAEEK